MSLRLALEISALLLLRHLGVDSRQHHGVGAGRMPWQAWAAGALFAIILLSWTPVDLWHWRRRRRAAS